MALKNIWQRKLLVKEAYYIYPQIQKYISLKLQFKHYINIMVAV